MKKLSYIFTLSTLVFLSLVKCACCQEIKGDKMTNAAKNYISAFRHGEDFQRPITGLVFNHQIVKSEFKELGKELATGTPLVREKLVKLLVEVGFLTNRDEPNDFVLRNQDVIKLLSTAGLAKNDIGLGAAASALRNNCMPDSLATFNTLYSNALAHSTDPDLLLLIAKAKAFEAKSRVDTLAALPGLNEDVSVKIARAALGNSSIEDEFISQAKNATEGKDLADALKSLGYIGTLRSLREVAGYLRTPLTIHIEGSFERTVRKDALEALSYNFPDQKVLYDIQKPEDYVAAERFCTAKLGVVFEGPLPEFPPDRVYPIPSPSN